MTMLVSTTSLIALERKDPGDVSQVMFFGDVIHTSESVYLHFHFIEYVSSCWRAATLDSSTPPQVHLPVSLLPPNRSHFTS